LWRGSQHEKNAHPPAIPAAEGVVSVASTSVSD
jgi:hypothetical protein